MKRYVMLKNFISTLEDNDIAIFTGSEMCKEAYEYDRPASIYIEDSHGFGISVALGLAMGTDKRVFVFIGEGDLLRQLSALVQMKASLCPNIFLVLVNNSAYQSAGKFPNIMEAVKSIKAMIFNIGLVVFDFTIYFKRKDYKLMNQFIKNIRGPMAILVNVDLGLKKNLSKIDITPKDMLERVKDVIINEEIGTSLYDVDAVLNINDVKELDLGGIR